MKRINQKKKKLGFIDPPKWWKAQHTVTVHGTWSHEKDIDLLARFNQRVELISPESLLERYKTHLSDKEVTEIVMIRARGFGRKAISDAIMNKHLSK